MWLVTRPGGEFIAALPTRDQAVGYATIMLGLDDYGQLDCDIAEVSRAYFRSKCGDVFEVVPQGEEAFSRKGDKL